MTKREKVITGKIVFMLAAVLSLTACTVSADDYIDAYEEGTERVGNALTKTTLAKITYDVQEELTGLDERYSGKKKMSAADYRRVAKAQNKFYEAVEKRDRELSK